MYFKTEFSYRIKFQISRKKVQKTANYIFLDKARHEKVFFIEYKKNKRVCKNFFTIDKVHLWPRI